MKTLHLSIIVILVTSIISSGIVYAQVPNGVALLMKSNSVGKIYANFTFHVLNNQTWNFTPQLHASLSDPNSIVPKDLTIIAVPSSINENKSNVAVTYIITAKNDVKGVYALFLHFCGQSPLVVGLNESEVNPAVFNQFFTAVYECPAGGESTPAMNITGYSNIISKTISTNSNNTNNASLVNQLGEIPSSPLKQFKAGIKLSDIKCKENFMLITKHEDSSPACVTSSTAIVLAERGWTTDLQSHPRP